MKKQTLEQQLASAKKLKEAQELKIQKIELKLKQQKNILLSKQPKPIYERITTLPQVYKHLKVNPKKDIINIDGFNIDDLKVVINIIKRMRICKVYNENKLPTKSDYRYYPWHYVKASGSGLDFRGSCYNSDGADASSAARLSFLKKLSSDSYAKNFMDIEEGIVGL